MNCMTEININMEKKLKHKHRKVTYFSSKNQHSNN